MKVSIVILNYNHPEVIEICLRSLANTVTIQDQLSYEVIVVDNGSEPEVVDILRGFQQEGLIDTLVASPHNNYFAKGNNLGVEASDPDSDVILLLNSDVGFIRFDWLIKAKEWLEGTPELTPTIWAFRPTVPKPGPKDILSIGWSHDAAVEPSHARPEGWCCFIRRKVWTPISEDFPWHYGLEEMLANAGRKGARIGVLFNYAPYLVHREGGSGTTHMKILNKRTPDIPGWFRGVEIETLDFTLGPHEHDTYMSW